MAVLNEKLPKRFKNKWVKMLRSSEYSQGQHKLKSISTDNTYSYCCLGVACLAAGYKPEDLCGGAIYSYKFPKVPKILCSDYSFISDKLIAFNDNKKWSFKKIASYIERYL